MADPLIGQQVLGYRIMTRLGQGSFGTVYRGEKIRLSDIFDEISPGSGIHLAVVAIKCIEKNRLSKSGEDNLVREISTLKQLEHRYIVKLIDFWWDNCRVYLLTEFCAGGDLATYLYRNGALSERLVSRVMFQLADALHHLHTLNFVHLDIKPLNILLTSTTHFDIKLADFGFARRLVEPTRALVGSLLYMAPEMVQNGVVDKQADIWSCGTVAYELLYGIPLFASKTEEELVAKLVSQDSIQLPLTPRISENCRDMIFNLLQRNPSERLSITALRFHPFIVDGEKAILSCGTSRNLQSASISHSMPMTNNPCKNNIIDSETFNVAKQLAKILPTFIDDIAKAVYAAEQAADAEKNSDPELACQKYTDAVALILPIHQHLRNSSDVDAKLKSDLRYVIDSWLKKGESAKQNRGVTLRGQERNCVTNVNASSSSSLPVPAFQQTRVFPMINVRKTPPTPSPSPQPPGNDTTPGKNSSQVTSASKCAIQ